MKKDSEKRYNTYYYDETLAFIELERKVINGVEYLLLLEKQEPNLMMVGTINEDKKLQVLFDENICKPILSEFLKDKAHINELILPLIPHL